MSDPTEGLTRAQKKWYEKIRQETCVVTSDFSGWCHKRRTIDARVEHALQGAGCFCVANATTPRGLHKTRVLHVDSVLPEGFTLSWFCSTTKTESPSVRCRRCEEKPSDPVSFGWTNQRPISDCRWYCMACTCHTCGDPLTRGEIEFCTKCIDEHEGEDDCDVL